MFAEWLLLLAELFHLLAAFLRKAAAFLIAN
jgi:hypothetical protein